MKRTGTLGLVLGLLLSAGMSAAAEEGESKPLFNGKNLDGWEPTPGGKWEVKNGVIIGTSPKSEPRHGILLTKKRFKDFVVKAKF
ncbi:MAG TPA: family 16 glycoside hydrolase, partial [Verrucomicrobiota bacterium]|nr:family 16 glycoside hydrolase [Verrucomicrobiota bacterium]